MFTLNFKLRETENSLYSPERGYGFFEPEMADAPLGTAHEQALKSGGWNRRHFYEEVPDEGRRVKIIKITVPSFATYKVTVRISALSRDISNLTLFSSRRAMIARNIDIAAKSSYQKSFHTAVTPYIPALSSVRNSDRDIFISFTGSDIEADNCLVEIIVTEERVSVIWIGGDSTVTDQNAGIPYYPSDSFSGWAQTLPRYIDGAAVCNLAHSGLTSNCFRDDGHYDIIMEMIKPGDALILQFGHNDQKRRNLAAFGGYADNFRRYVQEIRDKGAEPILCSPISRIPCKMSEADAEALSADSAYSLLSDYAEAVKAVAEEADVFFADLHALTFRRWIECGEGANAFFMPGDVTHTNEFGSVLIADMFMNEIRTSDKGRCTLPGRCDNHLISSFWNPSSDAVTVPKQAPEPDIFAIDLPYVDIKGFEPMDELVKAFRYCLLDPCVMHLHPDATLPRAQLLMVLFKALRIAGKRPYMGKFADIRYNEWDSGYVEALISENLIDPATIRKDNGKLFFRPDEDLTYDELDSFLMRFYEPDSTGRDIPIDECVRRAKELGIDKRNSDSQEKYATRGMVYCMLARFIDLSESVRTRSINFEA
jgi:lysophospholipase L1-like esterase